jgi:hypothetical protein
MESKTIFKLKDVVYVTSFGWGIVIDAGCSTLEGWVGIETNSGRIIHVDTYLVSFTEYTLDGFSQDRPEDLPNEGDIVWVKDEDDEFWQIGHFYKKVDNRYLISSGRPGGWSIMGTKMTTTNPYK